MPRSRFAYALLLTLATCSVRRGPSLQLVLAAPSPGITSNMRCGTVTAGQQLGAPTQKVRITLIANKDTAKPDFCDRIFNVSTSPPYFELPAKGATTYDIYAEGFGPAGKRDPPSAGGFQRTAFGSLSDVPVNLSSAPSLRMYPGEDFGCGPTQLQFARAFHTATLLPDGRVLFVGGLAASETAGMSAFPSGGATATGYAEVYDPIAQTTTTVAEAANTTPTPRAFHAAALLTSKTLCSGDALPILLVGGLTPGTSGTTDAILNPSKSLPGSRFQPDTTGTVPQPLDAEAAGNELLCLDLSQSPPHATRSPITGAGSGYRAATSSADGLIVAGGVTFDYTTLNTPSYTHELDDFPIDGGVVATGTILYNRHAATLTSLGNGQAVLWGGNDYGDPSGELLSDLDGAAPYSAPLNVAATTSEFATATLLDQAGPPSILVTGGFEVVMGGVNTQPPVAAYAVQLLTVTSGVVTTAKPSFGSNVYVNAGVNGTYPPTVACTDATRYRPAGFESAVPLARGRVLVTGGSPSTTNATSHCQDCYGNPTAESELCALQQASLYVDGALEPANPMQVPRFGHTSTIMPDGNILIAGGIGNDVDMSESFEDAVFLYDIEVYNPRTLSPPYDSTAAAPVDDDDPAKDVLATLGYTRAPGEQAVGKDGTKPVASCGSL